jgi:hypothetical protein
MSSPSTWATKRTEFQNKLNEHNATNLADTYTEINTLIKGYLGQNKTQANYERINTLLTTLNNKKDAYKNLDNAITAYIKNQTIYPDILTETTKLQRSIKDLYKSEDEMKVDVESAIARDKLLRSRNTDITSHQLYLLDRPIRHNRVPYLWALSTLFIGIGIIVFYLMAPTIPQHNSFKYIPSMIYEFLTQKGILLGLLGACAIVILFLSLKIAGVFGK